MRRRSALQLIAASAGLLPFRPCRVWAQTLTFPGAQAKTLEEVARIVLPASIGNDNVIQVVQDFSRWVQDYRPGADTDHGYGHTHVTPLPASPAPIYLEQLTAMQPALLSGAADRQRAAVLDSLSDAGVKDLTPIPRGKHVIADLMSFYFFSSDANDLCYEATIERFRCRGVEHSELPPRPLNRKL
jgi:hypothetical protein